MDVLLFTQKAVNRLILKKNIVWRFLPINTILKKRIGSVCIDASDFTTKLQDITGKTNSKETIAILSREKEQIITFANEIISGKYQILGSQTIELTHINWHKDFKSGYCWEKNKFYLKYKQVNINNNADVKVPREISRCHHLLWLGEAYMLTKEEKYANEIIHQLEHWIEENPLMYSINWGCAMDVAIRAINWIYSLSMLEGYNGFTDKFASKVYYSLFQHMFFISNNKERNIPYSNNHYASDILGLLVLGFLFKDNRYGKKIFDFALKEFYTEVRNEILPSGVQYEKSTSYHRLVTELFVTGYTVLARNGFIVPNDIKYRITRMLFFIKSYTKPNGFSPMVSDNDDGRILPFMKRDFREHLYLTQQTSVENSILYAGIEDGMMLLPLDICNDCDFSDSGFSILKTSDSFLFITNGGAGTYFDNNAKFVPTHTHNDLLSFDLNVYGMDIIVDAGSYIYTANANKRNEFRSTEKHNTIVVDNEEQNELSVTRLFGYMRNSEPLINHKKNATEYLGSYRTFKGNMTHKREFNLSELGLNITDYVSKKGDSHNCELYLHFAKGINPYIEDGYIYIESESALIKISFSQDVNIEIIDDTVSPSYGVLNNSKTAIMSFIFDNYTSIETRIMWNKK